MNYDIQGIQLENNMKLHTYLLNNNIKQAECASLLGVSNNYIHYIISGKRKPSLKLSYKIEKLTGKKVSYIDLITGKACGKDKNERYKSKNFVSPRSKETKDRAGNKKTAQFSLL